MKRYLALLSVSWLLGPFGFAADGTAAEPSPSAESSSATAQPSAPQAWPSDLKETIDLLKANVRNLMADADDQGKKLTESQRQLEAVRGEFERFKTDSMLASSKWATQANLEEAVKRILESVGQKQESDRQVVLEAITNLQLKLLPPPAVTNSAGTNVAAPNMPSAPEPEMKTIVHLVKAGEVLGSILKTYNDDFKSRGWPTISMDDLLKANRPEVTDPNKVREGHPLRIPVPMKP